MGHENQNLAALTVDDTLVSNANQPGVLRRLATKIFPDRQNPLVAAVELMAMEITVANLHCIEIKIFPHDEEAVERIAERGIDTNARAGSWPKHENFIREKAASKEKGIRVFLGRSDEEGFEIKLAESVEFLRSIGLPVDHMNPITRNAKIIPEESLPAPAITLKPL